MKKLSLLFRFFIVILTVAAIVGCSQNQKVVGRVSFTDGTPVPNGIIYFTSDTYMGRANIASDGTFSVSSLKKNDGLPEGVYKVYLLGVFKPQEGAAAVADDDNKKEDALDMGAVQEAEITTPLIHPKYCSADTTPLTYTVPGDKKFEFEVEPFPTD